MDTRLRATPKRKLPYALHDLFAQIRILATQIQYDIEDYPTIAELSLLDLSVHYSHAETNESHTFAEWAYKYDQYRLVLDWLYLTNEKKSVEKDFLLHWAVACRKSNYSIRKRVTEDGFDPTTIHPCGMTALDIAVLGNRQESLICLVELIKQNPYKQFALSKAFYHATKTGNAELAKIIASAGADLSYRDAQGNSALHVAVIRGDACILRLICQSFAKIDINACNAEDDSPAHLLARLHDSHAAESLLSIIKDSGLVEDPNHKNIRQATPLTIAAANGHEELVRQWLSNNKNDTPIILTQWNLHHALIKAASKGHSHLAGVLAPYVSHKLPALQAAIANKKDQAAFSIIPHINIKDACQDQEGSALHLAARYGRTDVVKRLCMTRINKYIEERTVQQMKDNGAEHKHMLFGKGLGQTASRKIAAATAYREYILGNGTRESLVEFQKELNTDTLGELKALVDKFVVNKPDALLGQYNQTALSNQSSAALRSSIYPQ